MSNPFERNLEVEGTFNFRDLGHYSALNGSTTRPGVLYRSAAIHDLPAVGGLGIRTVVDLRSASDVERDAGPLGAVQDQVGVRRVVTPLIPASVGAISGHEYLNERCGPGISADRYLGYIEIGSQNVRDVFQLFARADAFPAVVHCTAGKDRTGVIIALVLDLLGVDHETIVDDYELSNAAVPDLVAHFGGNAADVAALTESDMMRFGAPRQAMQGFLEQLHRNHGSARTWLSSIGVEDAAFETLEEVLLAPA